MIYFNPISYIASVFSRNYVDIEMWSESYLSKKDLSNVVNNVFNEIKNKDSTANLVYKKWVHEVEMYRNDTLCMLNVGFDGYFTRIKTNLDPINIKEICRNNEFLVYGERVGDFDVYTPDGVKVSNKTPKIKNVFK